MEAEDRETREDPPETRSWALECGNTLWRRWVGGVGATGWMVSIGIAISLKRFFHR